MRVLPNKFAFYLDNIKILAYLILLNERKMYNNKKQEYVSPEMEVLDARVERGFQASSATPNTLSNPTGNDSYAPGGEIGNNFD